jgi:hypothetical protein
VILDAPDVPTWEFREKVALAADEGCSFLHLFNPRDQVKKLCVLCSHNTITRPTIFRAPKALLSL